MKALFLIGALAVTALVTVAEPPREILEVAQAEPPREILEVAQAEPPREILEVV